MMDSGVKCLGNLLILNKKKATSFEFLVEKMKSKISNWKFSLLSQAGRNTLIKSVASAVSIYNMSVLMLPKDTINQIVKALRKFWRGDCFIPSNGMRFANQLMKEVLVIGTIISLYWQKLVGNT